MPGIDGIFFGPCDYSQSIGCPGEIENLEVVRVWKLVAMTAIKHGKFAATVGNLHNYKELQTEGFRFINIGADVGVLTNSCNEIISKVKGKQQ